MRPEPSDYPPVQLVEALPDMGAAVMLPILGCRLPLSNVPGGVCHPTTSGTTFDFLGFTHVWGRSLNGKNVVRQVTAKGRFARSLAAISEPAYQAPTNLPSARSPVRDAVWS